MGHLGNRPEVGWVGHDLNIAFAVGSRPECMEILTPKTLQACQGGKPAPAHCSLGDRIIDASREGNHFDVGEHAVFDIDRRDVAGVISIDEEDAATVPEVFAVFFAGFDVQFQCLSSHFLILILSVSMNMPKVGTKWMSAGKLAREECASAGEYSC